MADPFGRKAWLGFTIGALTAAFAISCGKGEDDENPCPDPFSVAVFPPRSAPLAKDPSTFVRDLVPLSSVEVPQMAGSDIVDVPAAVRLGKAFFWDVQAGSDGQTACASCHFAAGADDRVQNTIHPGPDGRFEANGVSGPGQLFNGRSITLGDDVRGSQGVPLSLFRGLSADPSHALDVCEPLLDGPFGQERQVTTRNAPTNIGAVFNRENFWDGRAHHEFNGLDPFGRFGFVRALDRNGCEVVQPVPTERLVGNASLASQALGPPVNDVEMTCTGRPVAGPDSLGAKLADRQPLAFQQVAATDGVLGPLSAAPENGLRCDGRPCTYRDLIAQAFGPGMAAEAEAQFGRIWGQALQAYQATLIPDQTPLDRFLEGDAAALTPSQLLGLDVFQNAGQCIRCHGGPTLSDASTWFAERNGLINEDGGDQGYHNIGVRPTEEDLGRATVGPNGLSFSLSGAAADRGAFKTPSLRNVALTAPYFHNGGKATLRDVLGFYIQGGDFQNPELATGIQPLKLTTDQHNGLLDFLENALTDCRVKMRQAPFDHPAIVIPNGPSLPAVGAEGLGPCP